MHKENGTVGGVGCGQCAAGFDGEIRVLDLFSGIGAMRLGLEQACEDIGLTANCVGSSEIDEYAIGVYRKHFSGTPALGDIRTLAADGRVPECDMLLAGFPCPAYSIAGRKLGFGDWRGRLFFDLAKVIKAAKPPSFLLENVAGLVAHDRGRTLATILEVLRDDLGYTVHHAILNSRNFGVPQNRPRIYIVGFRDGNKCFRFPAPNDSTNRVKEILEADPVDPRYYLSEKGLAGARRRKADNEAKGRGFGYKILDPGGVASALVCGGMGLERNLVADSRLMEFPALPRRKTPINKEGIRHLTPLECERLQGLPSGWTAGQSDSQRYKQLANAVTVPVIRAISRNLLEALGHGPQDTHAQVPVPGPDRHIATVGPTGAINNDELGVPRFIDLCSGIGGFRLAIEAVGGRCVFSSEIERRARETYFANFGEWPSGDIRAIRGEDVPEHDVLCGGFPCQCFSISGKQLGFADKTRGTVFHEIARIIAAKKPAVVFLENVPNLLKHGGGRTFGVILETLMGIGYTVFRQVLNAGLYGIPTARKRLFIVAFRSDLGITGFEFPEPSFEPVRLANVLLPDSETGDCVIRSDRIRIDDEAVANANPVLRPIKVGQIGEEKQTHQGERIYSPQGLAVTFMSSGGGMGAKTGLYLVNGRVRRLHPTECRRAMGFPDSFVIPPSVSADRARSLFGNSVVVPVVRRIYESIAAALSKAGWPAGRAAEASGSDGIAVPPAKAPGAAGLAPADAERNGPPAYAVASLFSGCGGMDHGFVQAGGFEIVVACEWDNKRPAIARTYVDNHPETRMVNADIRLPETKDRICALFRVRRCDVLIGAPPCVAFSTSGRRDPDDPRGRLFEDYLEIVNRLRPAIVVMENVIGILSPRKGEQVAVVERIVAGLAGLGYRVEYRELNAADYGVPQKRRRVIIVAARPGMPIRFPQPTHAEETSSFDGKLPWVTVRDAIGDLADAPEDRNSWHVFTAHKPAFRLRMQRTPFGSHCGGRFKDGYRRDWPDRPSSLIKTVAWPIHYAHPRRTLTCLEAARLQSFPDTFRFAENKTDVATMIGNAVPPLLARAVAGSVREMLDHSERDGQPGQSAIVRPAHDTPRAPVVIEASAVSPLPETVCNVSAPTAANAGTAARLLANCSSKKGPMVWAMSIAMPGGRRPFASPICSKLCYAEVGQFPLHTARYKNNYQATTELDFIERACGEIEGLAWRNAGGRIAICAHEKGELYSLDYLQKWGRIIREMRSFPNVSFFIYTRSWISEEFRKELDMIAARNGNVKINLSTDRDMNGRYGVPHRVGDGMVVHLAETDDDAPPAGIDIVLRNLRVRNHAPIERLGGALVCPNESSLYVAKERGLPVIKGGKTVRIRCQDCRLCIDRDLDQWEEVKSGYAGTPGMPATGAVAAG